MEGKPARQPRLVYRSERRQNTNSGRPSNNSSGHIVSLTLKPNETSQYNNGEAVFCKLFLGRVI